MNRAVDNQVFQPAGGQVDIRAALPRDARKLAAVHRVSWRDTYSGLMSSKALIQAIGRRSPRWWKSGIDRGHAVLVTEVAGTLAGYTTLGRNRISQLPQEGEIYELYLMPEWKRMGLGRLLFGAAREALSALGYKGLVLWALAENANARAFYERIGGRAVAEGDKRYGDRRLRMVAYAWD